MRIAVASDHAAIELRGEIARHLSARGFATIECGPQAGVSSDYPDQAAEVAHLIVDGQVDRGVLVCGTGIGMSIAANKFAGIRAALVHSEHTATLAAQHNNANVLCLGGRVLAPGVALACVDAWLDTEFEPRHQGRLDKIAAIESAGALVQGVRASVGGGSAPS